MATFEGVHSSPKAGQELVSPFILYDRRNALDPFLRRCIRPSLKDEKAIGSLILIGRRSAPAVDRRAVLKKCFYENPRPVPSHFIKCRRYRPYTGVHQIEKEEAPQLDNRKLLAELVKDPGVNWDDKTADEILEAAATLRKRSRYSCNLDLRDVLTTNLEKSPIITESNISALKNRGVGDLAGMNFPTCYVGQKGSRSEFHQEDSGCEAVSECMFNFTQSDLDEASTSGRGANAAPATRKALKNDVEVDEQDKPAKVWLAVTDTPKFINAIFLEFGKTHVQRGAGCACLFEVDHKELYITPSFLQKYNVPYVTFFQYPRDIVFLRLNLYHVVVNLRSNFTAAQNYASDAWLAYIRHFVTCPCPTNQLARIVTNRDRLVKIVGCDRKAVHDCELCEDVDFSSRKALDQHLRGRHQQKIRTWEPRNETRCDICAEIVQQVGRHEKTKKHILPPVHVVAIAGEVAYLPCNITPSQDDDSVQLVLWFRESRSRATDAIYSLDSRDDRDRNMPDHWSDPNVFSKRAHFTRERKPAALGVDHIREDEAGLYRCRVEFRDGPTRNSKVNLTVIVPPDKISIVNERSEPINSSVGPFLEGDDLRIFCDVHGGKPTPTLSWSRDGRFVSSVSHRQRDGLIRGELVLKKLRRSDVLSEIACSANNNNSTRPLSASVRIDMNLNPLTVNIEGANQPLSAEKKQDLVCVTSGSRPPASVTWMKEDQRLPHSKDTTTNDGNTTTSVLSFTPSKDDAGKRLFCRAENEIMRSGPIEDERLLEIQYKPEAKIQLGKSLDPGAIKEGSDVYFDCIIEAEPTVYKVEWRHQGRTLHHNISRGVIISNQSLVLQGVDRTNAGNYTCVGFNLEGDGESRPFYLNVMFAPTCKANQSKVHGVAKQEKASISCQVDANPVQVEFRWSFNNSAESVDLSGSHVFRNGTTSVAEYTPNIELDYGTLLCWATNEIGHQQVPCVYHIIPAGRPDVVHNCSTLNTSKTSFELRCSDGFNGGLVQSFLLEVRELSSQNLKANVSSPTPHFVVSQLDAGSLYQAFVYAYNEKGRSEPIIVQAGTLSPPEKQLTSESERPRPPMRLTPMLSVMIGVVAALVIVAVIVMIVLRIQHSQVDEQGKSPCEDTAGGKSSKPAPIQRELRFRECDSLISDEKHHPDDSPFGKLDPIPSGDCSETDEKNPDIIPQQITGEEVSEYLRKRRLVSTIETSPSRSLLERSAVAAAVGSRGNYVGYCTIRSSMPLRDLSNNTVKFKHKNMGLISSGGMSSEVCESGMCTLPRQQSLHHHWPSPGAHSIAASSGLIPSGPTVVYTTAPHLRAHPHHHHAATLLQRGGGAAVTVQLPPTNLECCPGVAAATTTTITTPTQELLLPPPPAVAKPPMGPPQSILVNKRESSV